MSLSPIFIVGCPRSGTRLLRDLLRSHPRLAFPPESHFIPAFYRGYGHPRSERDAVALARRILGLECIRIRALPLEPSAFAPDRTFEQVVSMLYGAWAQRENKLRWGDKTPQYVAEIPTLSEIFPAARFLHIIRDGRDVALSWLKAGFGPRNLFTAAREWKRYVAAGRTAGATLPADAYLEIRYEALLQKTADTMQSVCAFVGEPFTDAVLRPVARRRNPRKPIVGKSTLPNESPGAIIRTNFAKWKTGMSAAERVLFESVAGDLLAALGYETEGVPHSIRRTEQIAWSIHHRIGWLMQRLNTKGAHRWLMTDWQMRRARAR